MGRHLAGTLTLLLCLLPGTAWAQSVNTPHTAGLYLQVNTVRYDGSPAGAFNNFVARLQIVHPLTKTFSVEAELPWARIRPVREVGHIGFTDGPSTIQSSPMSAFGNPRFGILLRFTPELSLRGGLRISVLEDERSGFGDWSHDTIGLTDLQGTGAFVPSSRSWDLGLSLRVPTGRGLAFGWDLGWEDIRVRGLPSWTYPQRYRESSAIAGISIWKSLDGMVVGLGSRVRGRIETDYELWHFDARDLWLMTGFKLAGATHHLGLRLVWAALYPDLRPVLDYRIDLLSW